MTLLHRFSSLLRNLLWRDRAERNLDAEVHAHLEMLTDELLARGLAAEEAEREARIELGGIEQVKEQVREVRMGAIIDQLRQDLGYGLRMLRKSPGFTAVAVFSLALGIGSNTAIFSVVDALMLRTLPVRDPQQLFYLVSNDMGVYATYQSLERYRTLTEYFSDVSAICLVDRYNVTISNPSGGPATSDSGQVAIALVSGNYFATLGAGTEMGRPLDREDDRVQGGDPVAVISDTFWERRLGRVIDVVGRTLKINDTAYTIAGVAAPGFTGEWIGQPSDVWIPITMQPQVMPERPGLINDPRANFVRLIARVKPDVTVAQAQAAADLTYRQILTDKAGSTPSPQDLNQIAQARLQLQSGARGFSLQRLSFAQPLLIVLVVVALVLLIACANVANLLLLRAAARHREIAVRLAMGASRSRVVRQLLTESFLLVIIGGAIGALFAAWGTRTLAGFLGSGLPRMGFATPVTMDLDLHLDPRMLAFTAAVCMITGLLFGLAPAFRGSRVELSQSLGRRGADSGGRSGRFNLGKALVIFQVALSLLLLVGAGLFARTLRNLKSQDIAIDREHVLLVWAAPFQAGRTGTAVAALYRTVQDRISRLPGVVSASVSNSGVLTGSGSGGSSENLTVQGQSPKPGLSGGVAGAAVEPRFFETLGMPLLAGRDFTEQDTETAPHVAIINETLARFEFGDQNPIGQRFSRRGETGISWEIIGVVKDTRDRNLREQNLGVTYAPYRQQLNRLQMMCVAVRASGSPAGVASSVRQELHDIDPGLPVLGINTVEEQLNGIVIQERLMAMLAGFFGLVAAILACIGLYGVISYTVARRTNEIGIRLALGARPLDVFKLVLREGLTQALIGMALGLAAALAVTRVIASLLFGVTPTDPINLVLVCGVLLGVALGACFVPARRATKVDPMVALRYE